MTKTSVQRMGMQYVIYYNGKEYDVKEFAEIMECNPQTIRHWLNKENYEPFIKKLGFMPKFGITKKKRSGIPGNDLIKVRNKVFKLDDMLNYCIKHNKLSGRSNATYSKTALYHYVKSKKIAKLEEIFGKGVEILYKPVNRSFVDSFNKSGNMFYVVYVILNKDEAYNEEFRYNCGIDIGYGLTKEQAKEHFMISRSESKFKYNVACVTKDYEKARIEFVKNADLKHERSMESDN